MMEKSWSEVMQEYRRVKESFSKLNSENKTKVTQMISDLLANQRSRLE